VRELYRTQLNVLLEEKAAASMNGGTAAPFKSNSTEVKPEGETQPEGEVAAEASPDDENQ
jgi:hypothetical protein